MVFECGKCGAEIKSAPEGAVRCPKCGHRILYKKRESISKEIRAD